MVVLGGKRLGGGEMSPSADNQRTVLSRHTPPLGWLIPYAGLLFAALWLFFSAGFVSRVLETGLSSAQTFAFLASLVVFAAPFVLLMVRYPFPDVGLTLPELRVRLGLIGVLTVLALYVETAYGYGIPWRFMYVVAACAVTLPVRYAAWAVLASTILAVAFYGLRSGWGTVADNWVNLVPFVWNGVAMIFVSRLVVMVRELHEARQEIARLAVSEERLRFARDLHDLLGHSLSSITLKSELAGRLLADAGEGSGAAKEVRDIQAIARGALREIREAVSGYRSPSLEEELAGAREMLEAAGISCRVHDGVGALPTDIRAILTWTVREGVTNVVRHSRAKRCEIRLTQDGDLIRAEVRDDGRGPGSNGAGSAAGGNGLAGLAERVEASGGRFEAGPLPHGGFRLRADLPLGRGVRAKDGERVPARANGHARNEDGEA
jgi:two-component system, NarL family, sensor histidine kinase DesK